MDSQGQGRAAVKETEGYDWDKEVEVNTLEVMAGFDYEAIATMDVSANRNDTVKAYASLDLNETACKVVNEVLPPSFKLRF